MAQTKTFKFDENSVDAADKWLTHEVEQLGKRAKRILIRPDLPRIWEFTRAREMPKLESIAAFRPKSERSSLTKS